MITEEKNTKFKTESQSSCGAAASGTASVELVTEEKKIKEETNYYKSGTVTFTYRSWFGWRTGRSHLPFCDEGKKTDIKHTFRIDFLNETYNITFPNETCNCNCTRAEDACVKDQAAIERFVRTSLGNRLDIEVPKAEKEMNDAWRQRVSPGDTNGSIVTTKSQPDASIISSLRSSYPSVKNISINRGPWRKYGGRNPQRETLENIQNRRTVRVSVGTTYVSPVDDSQNGLCRSGPQKAIGVTNLLGM